MHPSMTKVIAVLNDFSMLDAVLEKTFYFAKQHHAVVEILYVHESPLWDIPDFFQSTETNTIDKEKIKAHISEKVHTLHVEKEPAIFVKIDDTPDRVWALAREDEKTFIVTTYHEKITQKLIDKTTQPIFVLKKNNQKYQKMALVIDGGSPSSTCIDAAKTYFPESNIELFYDYRYIVDPEMEASLQNVQIIEDAQKEAFEALKREKGLDGKFFIDGDFLGTEMNEYLEEKEYDALYLCSHENGFFVSSPLIESLLETLHCDILVASR